MICKRALLFKKRFLYYFFLCLTFLTLGLVNPVSGQDEGSEDEFTLEEITVTAEKREAELQKIPIDISVVRPDDMSKLGVYNTDDLDKIIPEFNAEEFAGSFLAVSIRNVTTNFWNVFHETTVAMHMDGVQLTRPNGLNNFFFDLQRVEVLKGPQGTLYGRGSTAGSMNIVSQKPIMDEFSGHVTLQVGNYSMYRTEGALNLPIAEKFALRIAGRTNDRDGYDDTNYGNQHQWAGRVSLNWEPTDNDQILMVYDFEGNEDSGQSTTGTYFHTYGGLTIYPHFNPTSYVQEIGPTNEIRLPYESRWLYGDLADQVYSDVNSWGFMGQWDHSMSWADFTFVYGHRSQREKKAWGSAFSYLNWRGFQPGTGWVYPPSDDESEYRTGLWLTTFGSPSVSVLVDNGAKFDSVEARLLSKTTIPQGDRFEWVLGAMAQRDNIWTWNHGTTNTSWVNNLNNSKAIFGQASYSIIGGLHLTAGYRYNWDKKQYSGLVDPMAAERNQDLWDALNRYTYKWDEDTYKINLSWEITDSVMPYIQYSKGYKTGNLDFNGNAVPPEILDSYEAGLKSRFLNNRLQVNGSVYYYDYQNYNEWGNAYKCTGYPDYDEDGNRQYDGFYEIYVSDPSLTGVSDPYLAHQCADVASDPNGTTIPSGAPDDWEPGDPDGAVNTWDYDWSRSLTVSPGGARQYGVSADVTYLITNNDTITARMTYSKNEYKDYSKGPAILALEPDADNPYTDDALLENRDGEEFSRGAPIRGNISYNRRMFIGMDMLSFSLTGFYNGKQIDQIVNRNTEYRLVLPGADDYWTADASISYASSRWVPEGIRWNARFQVNNIFDSDALSGITYTGSTAGWFNNSNIPPDSGYYTGRFIAPRTFSATLTVNF